MCAKSLLKTNNQRINECCTQIIRSSECPPPSSSLCRPNIPSASFGRSEIISEQRKNLECKNRLRAAAATAAAAAAVNPCAIVESNDLVNYGKVKDIKTRTQLYSYDYLSRGDSSTTTKRTTSPTGLCCKKLAPLVRDPNEFFYLDKLYNSTSSSSSSSSCKSSTRARICAHPAPLPNLPRVTRSTESLSCANNNANNHLRVDNSCASRLDRSSQQQVTFLDDHRINLDSRGNCCATTKRTSGPLTTGLSRRLPPNVSVSAGSLCEENCAPYTNYLEIGNQTSGNIINRF